MKKDTLYDQKFVDAWPAHPYTPAEPPVSNYRAFEHVSSCEKSGLKTWNLK